MSEEKAVLSFDGAVYLTKDGYNPRENTISKIPNYNTANPNNVQIFYHEYVLNTFVDSLAKSEITVPIVKALIETLGLEEAFSYLPFAENLTAFDYGIYSGLKSEFKFSPDELYGQLSPIFVMRSGDDLAYAFACTFIGDMNIYFDFKDDKTILRGKINNIEAKDFIFFPGTVK